MFRRTFLVIAGGGILFIILAFTAFTYYRQKLITQTPPSNSTSLQLSSVRPPCLQENEWAVNSWSEYYGPGRGGQKEGRVFIDVRDINTKETKFKFLIEDARRSANPLEIHKCGVYVIRHFNFDYQKEMPLPNYTEELWYYRYDGKGKMILKLYESGASPIEKSFSSTLRINDTETYLALIRSWYGDPEHAIVIKNLKTMEDVFVLTIRELVEIYEKKYEGKYAFGPGTFNLDFWYKDIFRFSVLNEVRPSFHLDTNTWEVKMATPFDEISE